jgi:hypothetical protein
MYQIKLILVHLVFNMMIKQNEEIDLYNIQILQR